MLAGITVSRKSADIVIGLLDSALSATTPPRLITPSELDLIQGGASALGMRVFYAVQDQPVGHLASGTKSSKGIASSRVEETQRDEPLVTCHCEFPPEWIRVRPIKGRTNEEAAIYGRADYCGAEGAGGW
ncbi:hypothetical protein, partial [Rhizobium leguminosarum]|uniref:hypothetical protein n=1 Tax=Rhizobium leguminosarum TaxID=384 RepID=UPI001C96E780